MNRIHQLFDNKKQGILSVYFCAGHPTLNGTPDTLKALQAEGIDMVEIGIPFSDPLADGPTIQSAASKALKMACRYAFSLNNCKTCVPTFICHSS